MRFNMRVKRLLYGVCALLASVGAAAQSKTIDNGGSGLFKAETVSEASLPGFVVYRPKDLYWAATREKKLPVLVWGNGGCMDTSIGYERMLTEVASQGYVVIAIGQMEMQANSRRQRHTPSEMMGQAVQWICRQARDKGSVYYDNVDTTLVAMAGHSCGGAQVLFNSRDPHLKTCIILNAGMGDMEMAGASRASLEGLHTPVLYLTGGEGDVAYANARLDYERISHVPVAWGDMPAAGHGGTYGQPGGGDFGRMLLAWMDWHLKGKEAGKNIFLQGDLRGFSGWSMKQKGFSNAVVEELWIQNGERRIYGITSTPDVERKKVAVICHGFNGTHHFGRDYFQTLNQLGYMVYTFDFPNGSIHSRSDNNTLRMSIPQEVDDLKAIVRHFQQRADVDKDNIVLIGESQGGLVAALAAGDLKDEVSRLVLVYPAMCIPDNWNARYPKESMIPDTTDLWGVKLGRNFFLELRKMKDVYKSATRYEGPVQIIQGSKDPIVPLSDSERLMKLYRQAHIGVISGAGHGFNVEQRKLSNAYVREFLE